MLIRRIVAVLFATLALSAVGGTANAKPLPPAEEDAGVCEPHEVLVGETCFPQGLPEVDTRSGSAKGAEGTF